MAWLFITAAAWLAVSCTQRETDIGRDALHNAPEDTFIVLQGTGTDAIMWHPNISNGRGKSLQVGDAGGFSAFFAMRFNVVAALPESARVDCMVVHLNRNRIWPESGALPLTVRISEITERWTEDSLLAGYLPNRASYPAVIPSWTIPPSETSFGLLLPDTMYERWAQGDTNSFGLLFDPISSGALLDFYSSESFDTAGSQGPTLEIYGVQWRLVDSVWTDTALVVKQTAEHDAYLATDSTTVAPGRLALSQGYAKRAALYFPLDSIGAANFTRVVNHAVLRFYADNGDAANFQYANIGLLYKDGTMANRLWLMEPDSAKAGLVATSSSAFDATNSYIDFDVSSTVAYWVARPDSNSGFQILASEENGHLTRQVFYGTAPSVPDSLKPRLTIWLTEQH